VFYLFVIFNTQTSRYWPFERRFYRFEDVTLPKQHRFNGSVG